MNLAHFIQKLHGLIGVLAVAACIHPVILLRVAGKPSPRLRWACRGAALLLTVTITLGWTSYLEYRVHVRGWMVLNHPDLHELWFELKEAIGWFVWTAGVAGWALVEFRPAETSARDAARRLFMLAVLGGLFCGVVGLVVSSFRDLA